MGMNGYFGAFEHKTAIGGFDGLSAITQGHTKSGDFAA
jgi:hypothetical protein